MRRACVYIGGKVFRSPEIWRRRGRICRLRTFVKNSSAAYDALDGVENRMPTRYIGNGIDHRRKAKKKAALKEWPDEKSIS